jgi:archaellum biogenesis protein FlaJ (TadC family)
LYIFTIKKSNMIEFIYTNKELAFWITVSSVLLFLVSLIIIPFLLVRIPPDYFIRNTGSKQQKKFKFRPFKFFLAIIKNLTGILLLLCGLAMLVLPGQGILTIIIAVIFIDFPGKDKFELWLISRPVILKTVNKMRKMRNRPVLKIPE